jgi:hypothetical protein
LNLKRTAWNCGAGDVVKFCTSFDHFLAYAAERKLLFDERTITVMDQANVTLQTVMGIGFTEELHALDQTIALLRMPEKLFQPPPDQVD